MPTLTSKELSAIQDQLGIEQNLIKKFNMYAETTQDAKIKKTCEMMASKHQKHFNTLIKHLQ